MIKSYIMDTDANEKIGQHFKVKEFACKDGSQVVFIDNHLVSILDILRNQVGKPVIITSGYRTPEWNKKCNGAKYSYHMRGMAADIRVHGMTPKQVANELNAIVPDECGIIVYRNWVHFDVRTGQKYRKGV
nr:MAG TPA: peptidase [Microviridae sp.]